MMSESQSAEIWNRLAQGKPLDEGSLGLKDGLLDLRGLVLPNHSVKGHIELEGRHFPQVQPAAVVRGAKWRDLDFSGSKLNGLQLFGCEIENCRFADCQLQGLRVWSTTFRKTSFQGTDLRKSALGAVEGVARNSYIEVDFSTADLRETVYKAASFEKCLFRNTKLLKIDFQTCTFANCRFEGELRDVLFYHRGFQSEAFPPNNMVNIDFSKAVLRDVSFRGLVLDHVSFPTDEEHLVLKNFASTLDRMTETLAQEGDSTARKLIAFIRIHRKWSPPNQFQGVINLTDLFEVVGQQGVQRFIAAIPK